MPRLLHAIDDTVDVEYSRFVLQESTMTRHALALPTPSGEWIAVGGPGGLLLHSAATDHHPAVRLELWDGTPPAAPGTWDHILELTCDLDTEVRLQSVTATSSTHVLAIAEPGPHHARTHVGNQDRAGQLDQGTFAAGIERWLIQLWAAQR
jgi:hypothetical protein